MQELFLAQAAAAHLGMALRLLDKMGADISATHVDAALQSLREEPVVRQSFQQFIEDRGSKFAEIDALIDEVFELWPAVPLARAGLAK